jgi:hypothetical protein
MSTLIIKINYAAATREMYFLPYYQFTVLRVSHMVNSNFQLGFSEHANQMKSVAFTFHRYFVMHSL